MRLSKSFLLLVVFGCASQKGNNEPLKLFIGEVPLAEDAVEDGDTIDVVGLDESLRLLSIDTEETYKKDADRQAAEADWEQYLKDQRGDSPKPVKMGTPMGEEASQFAKDFFKGVKRVRLERDHMRETRGYYNRYLTYVFVERDGAWVNFNVEAVRAGMSPYFTKYGYSRRFHDTFVKAEAEARQNKRGVWDPAKRHYPDYEERLAWWKSRADMIAVFEKEATVRDDFILLTRDDAMARLEERLGRDVVLLGAVGWIRESKGMVRVYLSRKKGADFPLIFFDREVFDGSHIADYKSELIRVRGTVERYTHKKTGKSQLQIVVAHPGQIMTRGAWMPGLGPSEQSNDRPTEK